MYRYIINGGKKLNGEEQAISANYDSIVIGGYSNPAYIRYYHIMQYLKMK